MLKRVYLDYAAATPLDPAVARVMRVFERRHDANPNSLHREGVAARRRIEAARGEVADLCGAHTDEILFTGNATEANFLALKHAVEEFRRAHAGVVPEILISSIEHASVFDAAEALARIYGVAVREIPVDAYGMVDEQSMRAVLSERTAIVSVMYVNNEFGTIEPIRALARVVKEFRESTKSRFPFFHTDACQAALLLDLNVARLHVDLMTLSSAKCFGPKGVGVLFVRRGVGVIARGGTEWGAGIVGAAAALTRTRARAAADLTRLSKLAAYLHGALAEIPGLVQNGDPTESVPSIVNFSIPGITSDYLALALDAQGFAVSAGSACAAASATESHAILALGKEGIASGVRVSLGPDTTMRDVRAFVKALKAVIITAAPYRFKSDI